MLEGVGSSLLVIARHLLDELNKLIDDGGHDQRGDEREDERHGRNDDERGNATVEAPAVHAIHEGLKQIG